MLVTRSGIFTAVALIFATLAAPVAFARGFAGGPPGFSKGMKTRWNGGSVPPGWSKGKKKGWRGANVPPGLYGR